LSRGVASAADAVLVPAIAVPYGAGAASSGEATAAFTTGPRTSVIDGTMRAAMPWLEGQASCAASPP